MSRISQSLASLAVVGLTGVASAAVVVDGYTWDYAYTGDALPTASTPTWSSGGTGSASVAGGELTISTTAVDHERYFQINEGAEWNPVSPGVAYIQFRAKVLSETGRVAGGIYFGGDSDSIALNLGDETALGLGVYDNAYNQLAVVDVNQYHTYRVSFNPDASAFTLWIDDLTPANYVYSGSNFAGGPYMYFGDGSGDHEGSIAWDYIAWNNNGEPVAIPEPAALSLLGLGALAIRRRK